jgi:hypothetical protein
VSVGVGVAADEGSSVGVGERVSVGVGVEADEGLSVGVGEGAWPVSAYTLLSLLPT